MEPERPPARNQPRVVQYKLLDEVDNFLGRLE
jgi:hypothetical protein